MDCKEVQSVHPKGDQSWVFFRRNDAKAEWEIDGETVGTVSYFILGGSKITADGDCSHEIKRYIFLGRKVMTKLDTIFKKQRHYFANKGLYSQGYGFFSSQVWR